VAKGGMVTHCWGTKVTSRSSDYKKNLHRATVPRRQCTGWAEPVLGGRCPGSSCTQWPGARARSPSPARASPQISCPGSKLWGEKKIFMRFGSYKSGTASKFTENLPEKNKPFTSFPSNGLFSFSSCLKCLNFFKCKKYKDCIFLLIKQSVVRCVTFYTLCT
jgi:hypothetical protein